MTTERSTVIKGQRLRELLATGTIAIPGAFNALTAIQIERAGFDALYVSGAAISAARGLPDIGLISLADMAGDAAVIANAVTIPVIVDADTGYGPPPMVMEAVREFERAGLAGMITSGGALEHEFFLLDAAQQSMVEALLHSKDPQALSVLASLPMNGFPAKPTLALPSTPPNAEPSGATASARPAAFNQICSACHSLDGRGGNVGPVLDHVATRLDADYLRKWLKNPASVKSDAKMPALGLSDAQLEELVSFLGTKK